jgi:hypothetical protein
MMIYAGLLLAAVTATASLSLLGRLRRARGRLRELLAAPDIRPLTLHLLAVLEQWLDTGLLADAGREGFTDLALSFREPHDVCENVGDLLRSIAPLAASESSTELLVLVKYLYQLQHTLGIRALDFDEAIAELASRIRTMRHLGSPVVRVEVIRESATVDTRCMWPLNYGTRVRQPLGVVLYGASGEVLNKAKVLCC